MVTKATDNVSNKEISVLKNELESKEIDDEFNVHKPVEESENEFCYQVDDDEADIDMLIEKLIGIVLYSKVNNDHEVHDTVVSSPERLNIKTNDSVENLVKPLMALNEAENFGLICEKNSCEFKSKEEQSKMSNDYQGFHVVVDVNNLERVQGLDAETDDVEMIVKKSMNESEDDRLKAEAFECKNQKIDAAAKMQLDERETERYDDEVNIQRKFENFAIDKMDFKTFDHKADDNQSDVKLSVELYSKVKDYEMTVIKEAYESGESLFEDTADVTSKKYEGTDFSEYEPDSNRNGQEIYKSVETVKKYEEKLATVDEVEVNDQSEGSACVIEIDVNDQSQTSEEDEFNSNATTDKIDFNGLMQALDGDRLCSKASFDEFDVYDLIQASEENGWNTETNDNEIDVHNRSSLSKEEKGLDSESTAGSYSDIDVPIQMSGADVLDSKLNADQMDGNEPNQLSDEDEYNTKSSFEEIDIVLNQPSDENGLNSKSRYEEIDINDLNQTPDEHELSSKAGDDEIDIDSRIKGSEFKHEENSEEILENRKSNIYSDAIVDGINVGVQGEKFEDDVDSLSSVAELEINCPLKELHLQGNENEPVANKRSKILKNEFDPEANNFKSDTNKPFQDTEDEVDSLRSECEINLSTHVEEDNQLMALEQEENILDGNSFTEEKEIDK